MDADSVITWFSIVPAIAGLATAVWAFRRPDQDVNVERQRLRHEVLGEAVEESRRGNARLVPQPSYATGVDRHQSSRPDVTGVDRQQRPRPDTPGVASGEDNEGGEGQPKVDEAQTRFAKLLIEYYAYGLTQARRSFSVSLTCSVVGGLVLLSGIGMAIFKAESTGDQYASVTASVAGLLMTVIGTLFHRRADQALKHMESQTQSLRQDMKVERDAGQAIRLLEDVDDPALKAHLQAALILKFSAAKLPELGGVLKPADPLVQPSANGAVPQQQSENTTS
ncbi:TRADD-N-associated membrane domain-containing protein [Streptomyces cellulosae]